MYFSLGSRWHFIDNPKSTSGLKGKRQFICSLLQRLTLVQMERIESKIFLRNCKSSLVFHRFFKAWEYKRIAMKRCIGQDGQGIGVPRTEPNTEERDTNWTKICWMSTQVFSHKKRWKRDFDETKDLMRLVWSEIEFRENCRAIPRDSAHLLTSSFLFL